MEEQIPHYQIDESLIYRDNNNNNNDNLCIEIACVITVLTCGCTIVSLLLIGAIEGELNYNFTI